MIKDIKIGDTIGLHSKVIKKIVDLLVQFLFVKIQDIT